MEPLALTEPVRKEAVASIRQYAEANFAEPLGELAAGSLLNYFLEEIAPAIYNQAVSDVQVRLQARIADLHGEIYAEPFQYWSRLEKRRKTRR